MKARLSNIQISHIASGLPRKEFPITNYESIFGAEEIARLKKSTGVESIHISEDEMCASDYAVVLTERLHKETGLSPTDFDGILFVSQTPDYRIPATSVILQDRLGFPKSSVAFDLNFGCSGYIYGLYQAALLISSGSCSRVLLFTGDTKMRMIHEKDRKLRMVLGDGFAVTVIEKGSQELYFNIQSDGSGYRHIYIEAGGYRRPKSKETEQPIQDAQGNLHWPEYTYMDGLEVMNFALTEVPPLIHETLGYAGWELNDVGTFALHQANQMILSLLSNRIGVDADRIPISLRHMGNTAAASIPLMLSDKHRELSKGKRLEKTLLCGFGIGFSWGAATADLSGTEIHDIWEI